ncbi:MAG: hypothetical protein IJE16_08490 [Ruminococcus sp.]|nr:hypothetical protein [Ruminococcus sp.]
MKITKCPYCGKQLTFFQAFLIRNRGEFFCNKCKKESNILIKKAIIAPFIGATILSLIILAVFLFMTERTNLWFMFLVAIPFLGFYLLTPFYVDLKPRKKHMDVLYDTGMIESPIVDPDPTMAKTSRVMPNFVDDVVLTDDDKPVINEDIFNAIKEDRKVMSEQSSGDTKSFSKFENISSNKASDATMPVDNLKNITGKITENESDDILRRLNIDIDEF